MHGQEYRDFCRTQRVPETDKLTDEERDDFLRIHFTDEHMRNSADDIRWNYLTSKVDPKKYEFEIEREMAKTPREIGFTLEEKNSPYVIDVGEYDMLLLPDELAPPNFGHPPEGYCGNVGRAIITADLDTRTVTSFKLLNYLEKLPDEEVWKAFDEPHSDQEGE